MGPDRAQILQANDATYEAWNARDPEAVAAVFAEEAEVLDVGHAAPFRGRAAIVQRAEDLLAAFSEFEIERLQLLIDPPANADRWRVRASHTGDFVGVPATGNRIDVQGCTFSTFGEDGLVVRDVNFWDVRGLLEQMSPEA